MESQAGYGAGRRKTKDDPKYKRTGDFNYSFTIKIDKTDLYAVGDTSFEYPEAPELNEKKSFSGKIGKAVLTDNLSERLLENARSQLFSVTQTWDYISGVSDLAGYAIENLNLTDTQAVSEFVRNHQITSEENGDKVKISFVLDTGAILSELADDAPEFAKIKGEMEIEKESGKVLSYRYDLTDYAMAVQNTMKEEGDDYDFTTDCNTALLLYYTLVSDGVKMDHEFMNKLLGNSKVADEKAPLVTRVIGEYNLPSDSDLAMKAYVARGKYFKEGQLYSMTNLPDNASRDHIATAKRFTGDFFHPENGSLDPSWSLNAIAIYGEYHRWWFNPESVFLHGPSVNKHVSASQTRKVAETIGTYDVVHYNFTATNYYNALYNVPLAK